MDEDFLMSYLYENLEAMWTMVQGARRKTHKLIYSI